MGFLIIAMVVSAMITHSFEEAKRQSAARWQEAQKAAHERRTAADKRRQAAAAARQRRIGAARKAGPSDPLWWLWAAGWMAAATLRGSLAAVDGARQGAQTGVREGYRIGQERAWARQARQRRERAAYRNGQAAGREAGHAQAEREHPEWRPDPDNEVATDPCPVCGVYSADPANCCRKNSPTPDQAELTAELRRTAGQPATPKGTVSSEDADLSKPLHQQIYEEDQDRMVRQESLVGLFGDAIVNAAEYEQEARDVSARRRFAAWFNEFSEKKTGLSPEQIQAEYAKGRRLAAQAGITEMGQAREVLDAYDAQTAQRGQAAETGQAHATPESEVVDAEIVDDPDTNTTSGTPAIEGTPQMAQLTSGISGGDGEGYATTIAALNEIRSLLDQVNQVVTDLGDVLTSKNVDQATTGLVNELDDHLQAAVATAQQAAVHAEGKHGEVAHAIAGAGGSGEIAEPTWYDTV